jgi:hypothetical protein
MAKLSELNLTLGELRSAAQSLLSAADLLAELFSSSSEEEAQQPVAQPEPAAPAVTLEQVRAVLADKSRAGKTAAVRELLLSHGAEKLSAIDPAEYAAQGTDAHTLCEERLKVALGLKKRTAPLKKLTFFDEEMSDCANEYVAFILEQAATIQGAAVFIEQRVDMSRWVPDASGTCDCCIIGTGPSGGDGILHIIDFKYGKGVPVAAEDNPQFRLYALGALEAFDCLYDIKTVRMSVFQPRLQNADTCEMTKDALLKWADEVLKPAAQTAFAGEGDYCAGEHCRFCKIKAQCRERANANLALAAYDFTDPVLLENAEIADILGKIDRLTAWASDVKEFALSEALGGAEFPGFKIVEGRSNRKYTDETAVAEMVQSAGYDPFEHKVIGITAMEKLVGKTRFGEPLGGRTRAEDDFATDEDDDFLS